MLRSRNRVFEEVTLMLGRFAPEKQNSMHFGHEILPYADIFVIEKLPSMLLMGTVKSLCCHTVCLLQSRYIASQVHSCVSNVSSPAVKTGLQLIFRTCSPLGKVP